MRVCVVTVASYAHGIGGMQSHGVDLVRGLVRAGHEVEVIAPRRSDRLADADYAGAQWHFLDVPGRKPNRPMLNHDWISRSAELFEAVQRQRPFDVVHSESSGALGLLRRGVHRRIPVAVKFHGNFLGLAKQAGKRIGADRSPRSIVREAKSVAWLAGAHFVPFDSVYRFRVCEAMVPSHQQLVDTRRSLLLQSDRIHVVPNGIDVETFRVRARDEARAELGLGRGTVLVSVGRLNREKGFDVAIRALAQLDGAARSLVIVGTGEERGTLERLSHKLGVRDRVSFVGDQPPERVSLFMGAADVVLFPTVRDEAAGLVLLEAMSCGRPVIASRVGAIPDVVESGKNGVLVPPGDPAALTEAIAKLLGDDERRAKIADAARATVTAEYTVDHMIQRTIDVYRIAARRLGRSL